MTTTSVTPSAAEFPDRSLASEADVHKTAMAIVGDQRLRSMSAHPSQGNRALVDRVESLHQRVRERALARHDTHRPNPDAGITLALHGDLNSASMPFLEGVLHALELLQPTCLSVNLAQVGRVSRESLRIIERCGEALGAWALIDPSPSACADLMRLGRSELVESGDLRRLQQQECQ